MTDDRKDKKPDPDEVLRKMLKTPPTSKKKAKGKKSSKDND